MNKIQINRGSLPMLKLTLPLIGEQFFRILVSSVDTLMLRSYSEDAVAGVGLVTQWVFFLQILINVICIGSNIVLAQYLGSQKDKDELNHIAKSGIKMVLIISSVLTLIVFALTNLLLSKYTLEPTVRESAKLYFLIYGGGTLIFLGINTFQTGVLRSYGYSKESLIVAIISNLVNVLGNAISLYGWFGLPVLGVYGVAGASALSIIVGDIVMLFMIKRRKDIQFRLFKSKKVPNNFYRMILRIGLPTAGENLAYNAAQIRIMQMITLMGTYAMNSQIYTQTICRFVFAIAIAIGNAVQIKVGYLVGAGEKDVAYKKVFKYSLIATSCSMISILLVNLIKSPIISAFTDIPQTYDLTSKLLLFSIYLEFGRSLNLIYVSALKGAGDIKFPVLYGVFSMWGIMVLLSRILGVELGFGVVGCWLGIATDETTRGIVMLIRWKSKVWQRKNIVESIK